MAINTGLDRRPSAGLLAGTFLSSVLDKYVARQHEKEQQRIRAEELAKQEQLRRDQMAQQQGQFDTSQQGQESRFARSLELDKERLGLEKERLKLQQQAAGEKAKTVKYKTQGDAARDISNVFKDLDPATLSQASELLFKYQADPRYDASPSWAVDIIENHPELGGGTIRIPTPKVVDDMMSKITSTGEVTENDYRLWFKENDTIGRNNWLRNVAFRRAAGEPSNQAKIGATTEMLENNIVNGKTTIQYPYAPDEKTIKGIDLAAAIFPQQAQNLVMGSASTDEREEFSARAGIDVDINYSLYDALQLIVANMGPANAANIETAYYGLLAPYNTATPPPTLTERAQSFGELEQTLQRLGKFR